MKVGDAVNTNSLEFAKATLLFGFIPKVVAETWLLEFPNVAMRADGSTPSERPMKDWETGYGVVVGYTPVAHKPIFLIKSLKIWGEYSLWVYDKK